MRPYVYSRSMWFRLWLLIATALTAAIILGEMLGPSLYSRLAIVAAVSALSALVISRVIRPPQPKPVLLYRPLPAGELALAIEHIQSIRILLEISSSHRQPIPGIVLVNLGLVLNSLRTVHRRNALCNDIDGAADSRRIAPALEEKDEVLQ